MRESKARDRKAVRVCTCHQHDLRPWSTTRCSEKLSILSKICKSRMLAFRVSHESVTSQSRVSHESVTSHHESVRRSHRQSLDRTSCSARRWQRNRAAVTPRSLTPTKSDAERPPRRDILGSQASLVYLSSNNGSASEHGAVLVTSPLSHLHLRSSRVADFLSVLRYTSVTLESLSHR
jgi:hypothetical protein